jgi:hypothetical protein
MQKACQLYFQQNNSAKNPIGGNPAEHLRQNYRPNFKKSNKNGLPNANAVTTVFRLSS